MERKMYTSMVAETFHMNKQTTIKIKLNEQRPKSSMERFGHRESKHQNFSGRNVPPLSTVDLFLVYKGGFYYLSSQSSAHAQAKHVHVGVLWMIIFS